MWKEEGDRIVACALAKGISLKNLATPPNHAKRGGGGGGGAGSGAGGGEAGAAAGDGTHGTIGAEAPAALLAPAAPAASVAATPAARKAMARVARVFFSSKVDKNFLLHESTDLDELYPMVLVAPRVSHSFDFSRGVEIFAAPRDVHPYRPIFS